MDGEYFYLIIYLWTASICTWCRFILGGRSAVLSSLKALSWFLLALSPA